MEVYVSLVEWSWCWGGVQDSGVLLRRFEETPSCYNDVSLLYSSM